MNKKAPLYVMLGMVIAMLAVSCNSSNDGSVEPTTISNNTAVTAFSLNADETVYEYLDSVFFSIDHNNRVIYNADSLPVGTDISGLTINASFATTTACKISQTGGTVRPDTVFAYSNTDTIDFTGQVKLLLTAADGTAAEYEVKVNVHKVEGDSLYWDKLSRCDLPNVSGTVAEQRTAMRGSDLFTLVKCDAGYVLSTTSTPADNNWKKVNAQFGMVPDVESFTATDDALYLLDENGALYTSADGQSWTGCGVVWSHIIGGYTNRVLGLSKSGDTYYYDEYPRQSGFASTEIIENFPVEGNSQMVLYTSSWNTQSQGFILGGITAAGKYRGDCWGYDGNKWTLLRANAITALADVSVFEYVSLESTGSLSEPIKRRAWYAIGGRDVRGDVSNTVYVSHQQGLIWNKADDYMQMPDYIDEFCKAQAFVVNSKHTRRTTNAWRSYEVRKPLGASTRTVAPINEWETPYIYLFGGVDSKGNTSNSIWRGVINRLSFAPLY